MKITRDLLISEVIFKEDGNEFKVVDSITIGVIHWSIRYFGNQIVTITYWTKKAKSRYYGMDSLPKAIKAWLVIQGISFDYQVKHHTPF